MRRWGLKWGRDVSRRQVTNESIDIIIPGTAQIRDAPNKIVAAETTLGENHMIGEGRYCSLSVFVEWAERGRGRDDVTRRRPGREEDF